MAGMRMAICGSRYWDDPRPIGAVIRGYLNVEGLVVVHGGAKGADTVAEAYCIMHHIPTETYEADWDQFGKAAGPRRNQLMVASGLDICWAFKDNYDQHTTGGGGTEDMVRRCEANEIPVFVVRHP